MNEQLKAHVEADLWAYARYVLPHYAFGDVHKECFQAMGDPKRKEDTPNLLLLIPRDHLKSVMIAVYVTWRVAKDPCWTGLYITADEGLGVLQMSFMQSIIESDRWRLLWPDHFLPEAGRREKWTNLAITCDHPLRKQRNIRDETIAVKTIKSGKTGRHPDEIMYDDLVVPENAYSEIGRREVRAGAAQAVSLAKTGALMTSVGTVYHPKDQYSIWKEATYQDYDDEGTYLGEKPLWHIIEKKVEANGDLTGDYLWPRTFSPENKAWYGWDIKSLSRKKAEYQNNGELAQFWAQYYMEANDPGSHRIGYDQFQYYDPKKLVQVGDSWEYNGKRLNIGAFMDTAATDAASKNALRADYTALAVMGIDTDGYYYVLDITQFQTDKRSVYAEEIIKLWSRWGFKTVDVELEGAGKIVAEGLKDYMRENGYNLLVNGEPAPRGISKFERHASITIPRYEQGIVFHRKGGWTPELEDQIVLERPAHDDLIDVVTMGVQKLKKPMVNNYGMQSAKVIKASSRFGGRIAR